ncbi:MAG: hypothetical protein M0T74_14635 [Desulfitobacterium hafniense]|nr:hypothetical protein [Desulfitobacterium hafniense]
MLRCSKSSRQIPDHTILLKDEVHPPSKEYVQDFAHFFNLNYQEMSGSLNYLDKLLHGPWDKDFVIVSGGQQVLDEMFGRQ